MYTMHTMLYYVCEYIYIYIYIHSEVFLPLASSIILLEIYPKE
jgi:hypothetical protein